MKPSMAACLLTAAFATLSPTIIQAKTSTPENLTQLRVSERARVIENEYFDQSGGARIPDEQIAFYLDQIPVGWTFSRIQQDIAASLRSGERWQYPEQMQSVVCASDNKKYRECPTPFFGPARLDQQLSNTTCVEGGNWGQGQGLIWVDGGCRAKFVLDTSKSGYNTDYSVVCGGHGKDFTPCTWNAKYGEPQLLEQYSSIDCIAKRTWGYDKRGLWVMNGCQARFAPR